MEERRGNVALQRPHIGQAVEEDGVIALVGYMQRNQAHIGLVAIGDGPVEIDQYEAQQHGDCHAGKHTIFVTAEAQAFQEMHSPGNILS